MAEWSERLTPGRSSWWSAAAVGLIPALLFSFSKIQQKSLLLKHRVIKEGREEFVLRFPYFQCEETLRVNSPAKVQVFRLVFFSFWNMWKVLIGSSFLFSLVQ